MNIVRKGSGEASVQPERRSQYDFLITPRWRKNLAPTVHEKMPCILGFDDGRDDVYIDYKPVADTYNVPITAWINTRTIGQAGNMTIDQLNELIADGHDVQSHAASHRSLPTYTESEFIQDCEDVHTFMRNNIEDPEHRCIVLATPQNDTSEMVERVASRYYAMVRSGVGMGNGVNDSFNNFKMLETGTSTGFGFMVQDGGISVGEVTIRARTVARVGMSNEYGGSLQITGHSTSEMTATEFGYVLDELTSDPRLVFMTSSQFATWVRQRISPIAGSDRWSAPFGTRPVWVHPDLNLVATPVTGGLTESKALQLTNTAVAGERTYTFFHDTIAGTPMVFSAYIKSATGVSQSSAVKLQTAGTLKSTYETAGTAWSRVEWSYTPAATAVGVETGFSVPFGKNILVDLAQLEVGTVASNWEHPYPLAS